MLEELLPNAGSLVVGFSGGGVGGVWEAGVGGGQWGLSAGGLGSFPWNAWASLLQSDWDPPANIPRLRK